MRHPIPTRIMQFVKKLLHINDGYLIQRITTRPLVLLFITIIISIMELFFLIRGIVTFDFSNPVYVSYEVAYGVLLAFSLAAAIFILLTIKNVEDYGKAYYIISIIYVGAVIAFSTTVSSLDIIQNSSNQMIVYVTTILAIPLIVLINPYIYSAFAIMSTLVIVLVPHFAGNVFVSTGAIINYVVLDILVIFGEFSLYNLIFAYYKKEDRLNSLSFTDQLTGLFNRRKLDNDLKESIKDVDERPFAIIIGDIDDFKSINDKKGHVYGDEVLTNASKELRAVFGYSSYRYGGDEFAFIVDSDKEVIINSFEDIRRRLEKYGLTMSFGVYFCKDKDNDNPLDFADKALYEIKRKGKSFYSFFND